MLRRSRLPSLWRVNVGKTERRERTRDHHLLLVEREQEWVQTCDGCGHYGASLRYMVQGFYCFCCRSDIEAALSGRTT